MRAILTAVTLLIGSAADAATYYVAPTGYDSNPGSQAAPLRTIGRAATLARAGDTVNVLPGTYNEKVRTQYSGTSVARLRFVSTTKHAAKVRFSSKTSYGWLNGGSYVDIVGFDISGYGIGGIFNYGSYVRIEGNEIHHIKSICNNEGGGGIVSGTYNDPKYIDIIGNRVHHIGDYVNGCLWVQGIYPQNTGGSIQNNLVYRNSSFGIHLWHRPEKLDISGNTVFGNFGSGILVGAGDDASGRPADYVNVTNNISYRNGGYGIYEYGKTGVNNRYENNLSYDNARGNWRLLNGNQHLNSLSVYPGFLSYAPDGCCGDYRLKPGSPPIDAGTTFVAPAIDYDGASRPQGAAHDIGAYEQ